MTKWRAETVNTTITTATKNDIYFFKANKMTHRVRVQRAEWGVAQFSITHKETNKNSTWLTHVEPVYVLYEPSEREPACPSARALVPFYSLSLSAILFCSVLFSSLFLVSDSLIEIILTDSGRCRCSYSCKMPKRLCFCSRIKMFMWTLSTPSANHKMKTKRYIIYGNVVRFLAVCRTLVCASFGHKTLVIVSYSFVRCSCALFFHFYWQCLFISVLIVWYVHTILVAVFKSCLSFVWRRKIYRLIEMLINDYSCVICVNYSKVRFAHVISNWIWASNFWFFFHFSFEYSFSAPYCLCLCIWMLAGWLTGNEWTVTNKEN